MPPNLSHRGPEQSRGNSGYDQGRYAWECCLHWYQSPESTKASLSTIRPRSSAGKNRDIILSTTYLRLSRRHLLRKRLWAWLLSNIQRRWPSSLAFNRNSSWPPRMLHQTLQLLRKPSRKPYSHLRPNHLCSSSSKSLNVLFSHKYAIIICAQASHNIKDLCHIHLCVIEWLMEMQRSRDYSMPQPRNKPLNSRPSSTLHSTLAVRYHPLFHRYLKLIIIVD